MNKNYALKPKLKNLNEKNKKKVIDDYDIILTNLMENKISQINQINQNKQSQDNIQKDLQKNIPNITLNDKSSTPKINKITNLKPVNLKNKIEKKAKSPRHNNISNLKSVNVNQNSMSKNKTRKTSPSGKTITVDLTNLTDVSTPKLEHLDPNLVSITEKNTSIGEKFKKNSTVSRFGRKLNSGFGMANTKIVNLDLNSNLQERNNSTIGNLNKKFGNNNKQLVKQHSLDINGKNFDRSKSEKLFEVRNGGSNENIKNLNFLKNKKFNPVPTVGASLYDEEKEINKVPVPVAKFSSSSISNLSANNINYSSLVRTNSLNLKSARSLSKIKKTFVSVMTEESSLNGENDEDGKIKDGDDSLNFNGALNNSNLSSNLNFDLKNIQLKLNELKKGIKSFIEVSGKIIDPNRQKSMSPIRINYGNFRNFSLVKKSHNYPKLETLESRKSSDGKSTESNPQNISTHNNSGNYLNFEYNHKKGTNNVRFLNIIRMKKKIGELGETQKENYNTNLESK